MQFIISDILANLATKKDVNLRILLKYLFFLVILVCLYSAIFHFLMIFEGQQYSWITGFYWTLTVMSTLGFGDITFTTDAGKLFSLVVLMSGVFFLLIMLPFTFIQFFYAPWLDAQAKARAPRELPEETANHVILTNYDAIAIQLLDRLQQYQFEYVIVINDVQRAVELHDLGYKVVVGELSDPETYRRVRAEKAALIIANADDMMNTNIAFTVREIYPDVPIVANADSEDSVDILELAGSSHVYQFMAMLGQSLARRTLGANTRANVVGNIDSLLIAEAPAMRTRLQGKTLLESGLRAKTGVNVIGVWERGRFEAATAQTLINSTTVLLLAGLSEQLQKYDELFGSSSKSEAPVLILGGGRVGRAAAKALQERDIDCQIVEKDPNLVFDQVRCVQGSAADIDTLRRGGIQEAPTVIITTHDDPTNIYLTIYCRRLRPDIQIISRANLDRNVSKLHTAGADLVMSYGSICASAILNVLKPDYLLMVSEGLNVFRVAVHASLVGKSFAESHIRAQTGCSIIAVIADETMKTNADSSYRFEEDSELIVIGTDEGQKRFSETYPETRKTSLDNFTRR
jgi:Trk K+ transport system NAD-binding subunit